MFNKAPLDKKDKRNCFRRTERSKTERGRIFTQFDRKKIVVEKIVPKNFKERNSLFPCMCKVYNFTNVVIISSDVFCEIRDRIYDKK